jgi:signal transduction histidine kinase
MAEGRSAGEIIAGLGASIDRLEEITKTTLAPHGPAAAVASVRTSAAELELTVDGVIREVGARHPGVRWLKVSTPSGSPGVAVPPALLREIVLVLAENAAEASCGAGDVSIEVSRLHGMLNLIVRDRGPGLDPRLSARIFTPGATTKASGHGFGLYLARRLVESKGGRLTAAGADGGGARFSVSLPVHEN